MPDTGESTTRSRPALLVGSGRRPGELGAVLAALGAVRAQTQESRGTGASIEPHRPSGLSDLEELLAQRPREGILILDYERVPGEDIGFVRRFLERHAEWRLIVVGEDGRDRRARGLLGLPRAQWLPWPPDLDQIASLLPAEDSSRLPAEELEDPEARGNSLLLRPTRSRWISAPWSRRSSRASPWATTPHATSSTATERSS